MNTGACLCSHTVTMLCESADQSPGLVPFFSKWSFAKSIGNVIETSPIMSSDVSDLPGAFEKLRKETVTLHNVCPFACSSARMGQHGSYWTNCHEI
jgi:hypothetical protein